MVTQHFFHHGSLDEMEQGLLQRVQGAGKLDFQGRFAVHKLHVAVQELPDVVDAAPDLGHAPVHMEKAVYGFHGGAHGVLSSEDGVPGGLRELSQEGEVDTSVRNHVRAVALCPGHEEGGDIGHHGGNADGAVLRQLRDILHGHAQVVEPFFRNLPAGAFPHGASSRSRRARP